MSNLITPLAKCREFQMNGVELSAYRNGWWECRELILGKLRDILDERSGVEIRNKLNRVIIGLEAEIQVDIWEDAQREFPGMTREQYESELAISAEAIQNAFYSRDGYLRPRLVQK